MTAGYPSEEPIAGKPHDGICGGESQQWLSYPTFVQNRTLSGHGLRAKLLGALVQFTGRSILRVYAPETKSLIEVAGLSGCAGVKFRRREALCVERRGLGDEGRGAVWAGSLRGPY
jgi:hypothetical protein